MKRFSALISDLDQTTKTLRKIVVLEQYFREAPPEDRMWCLALFSGRRPKRVLSTTHLREWAAEVSGLPLWLLEDSYAVVGDLAETIGLVLPPAKRNVDKSLSEWISALRAIAIADFEEKRALIFEVWDGLSGQDRFVLNKLITGGFRVGVSQNLMVRALARVTHKTEAEIAHRLMGAWHPDETSWEELIEAEDLGADLSRPFPFFLAYGIEGEPSELGSPASWTAEWKWDGIRGQVILRGGNHYVWSRGEELITDRFPEFSSLSEALPKGTVLDGEILAWQDEVPLPFNVLQTRIGRKTVSKAIMSKAPVILYAYDILECQGRDIRNKPFEERRKLLENLCANQSKALPLRLSERLSFDTWGALGELRTLARNNHAEGLMIKNRLSPYGVGRKKGAWWKWKLDPLTIDAVMIYAQAGHGRRANLYTDFTFAVWQGNDLVPFAKAYSGLSDAEFKDITAWVRKNTLQRFGPVRQVTPEHVFEIAFEGIHKSTRHKSGVAVRFPRMARWRRDKSPQDANTLEDLKDFLNTYG